MPDQTAKGDGDILHQKLENLRDREAATRKVLQLVSENRTDEVPVFEAILENAQQLCHAPMSGLILATAKDAFQVMAAQRNVPPGTIRMFAENQMPVDGGKSYAARSIIEGRLIQFEDMGDSDLYREGSPVVRAMVDDMSIRSVLFVPLLKDGEAIGTITLFRHEVDPFDQRQIELVETFAVQAVIAIENVRQFRELQTRLERERAASETLEVISRCRDDETPVFEAVLRNARHLCKASTAALLLGRPSDPHLSLVGVNDADFDKQTTDAHMANAAREPITNNPEEHVSAQAVHTGQIIHIADLSQTEAYRNGVPSIRFIVDQVGQRTTLSVPLITQDGSVGAINLHRRVVATFSEDEIALVKSFAAQAAIAIENVRQFRALESLNSELGDRVKAQVSEIERMGKLKRFLPAAVADAVLSKGSEAMLHSHRALLGVLFCDIRGFTAFCETAEPEETIEVLQTYHEEMGKLINAYGAGVDHRMGDGIMVLFNDPLPCDDPAGSAVQLAIAMRGRMAELCKGWKRMGYRLGFGVGISLGYATVGMVGFEGRFDYTASGTAINLASRLCDEARDGEILLSPRASIAVEDDFALVSAGEVSLKGIREPLEIFKLKDAVAG